MAGFDPTQSVVTFVVGPGSDQVLMTHVPARDDDAIRQAWSRLAAEHDITADRVVELRAEWQPSDADQRFVDQTFGAIRRSYAFPRPPDDGWDAAFDAARRVFEAEARRRTADEMLEISADVAESTKHARVLPVLRSTSATSDLMTKATRLFPIGDGGLGVTLARVAWTPRRTIGMAHLVNDDFADEDDFFEQLSTAVTALAEGVVLEGLDTEDGQMARVTREDGFLGSSAILVSGFHTWISSQTGWSDMAVVIACPEELLIAPAESALVERWCRVIPDAQPQSQEILPSLLRITGDGLVNIELVLESSRSL